MKKMVFCVTALGLMILVGCTERSSNETTDTGSASAPAPSANPANYLLADEPEGAQNVIAVREADNDGKDILITGRIGGEMKPFVDGRVAFRIVDGSLEACSDIPGDGCETPWDYCCETDKLPAATALVKLVDENGNPVKGDAKELLNVTELSTVVIKGKAQRDDAGNLTVLADGVYVKK